MRTSFQDPSPAYRKLVLRYAHPPFVRVFRKYVALFDSFPAVALSRFLLNCCLSFLPLAVLVAADFVFSSFGHATC